MINFSDRIWKIPEKTNCIYRNFKGLTSECRSTLFRSQCCKFFGIELIDVSCKQFEDLQLQWRKFVRYLLNLHPRIHNAMLPHLIGSPSPKAIIYSRIYSRIICVIERGLQHEDKYISFFYRNSVINLHSYMSRNMNIILRFLNITYTSMLKKSESWLKSKCKAEQAPDWRAKMAIDLMQCREARDGLIECHLSTEELRQLLTYLCIE